jgi:N-glycosylase/DNA lyase
MAESIRVEDFELGLTLESGQFFQYEKHKRGYFAWVGNHIFYAEQAGNKVSFEGVSEERFRHIFALDIDYPALIASIQADPHIKDFIRRLRGLRIIRQEFYECLIAYVCSANANIPKITRNVNLLSEFYGQRQSFMGRTFHLFPKPGLLCNYDGVSETKTGFRAKYICHLNSIVDESWIGKLKALEYEEAKAKLMELPGVGPKVADCVLLFSLGKPEAFPVDVWIRRIMSRLYFKGKGVSDGEIYRFAQAHFGGFCGWANQFLFLGARSSEKPY